MFLFSCCSCLLAERYSSHKLQVKTCNHSTIFRGRPTKFVTSFSFCREGKRIIKILFNWKKVPVNRLENGARTHNRAVLRTMRAALKVQTKAAMLLSTSFFDHKTSLTYQPCFMVKEGEFHKANQAITVLPSLLKVFQQNYPRQLQSAYLLLPCCQTHWIGKK